MTPNPKDPRFIRHDVPNGASKNLTHLYKEFQAIQQLAQQGNWRGINSNNFTFEYSTYDGNAEILFSYFDRNEHYHNIVVTFYGDDVSTTCWFSYLFKAENFDEKAISVQSFAELLMMQLWNNGIDADLCRCDWGLEFSSDIDSIALNMDVLINAIITSIKPMDWFYSKDSIWKFYRIHHHLKQILPQIQHEAETGRWKGVKPDNFTILRDQTQAYIVLTYQEASIYDMTFKVGFDENGFDPDVSGEWFSCEYHFDVRTCDRELSEYYLSEEREYCKMASVILDAISYNTLFAYDEDSTRLTLLANKKWAFQKYCLMLDIMLPLLFKHVASKPLVTKSVLEQKLKLESLLNTEMEIVEDSESMHIFDNGGFLTRPEDPNTVTTGEMPF